MEDQSNDKRSEAINAIKNGINNFNLPCILALKTKLAINNDNKTAATISFVSLLNFAKREKPPSIIQSIKASGLFSKIFMLFSRKSAFLLSFFMFFLSWLFPALLG